MNYIICKGCKNYIQVIKRHDFSKPLCPECIEEIRAVAKVRFNKKFPQLWKRWLMSEKINYFIKEVERENGK